MKGYVIIGAEVISIAGYMYFGSRQSKNYNEYSLSTDPFETQDLFNKVQTSASLKKISFSLASAVWIYNVVDAYLNYDGSQHNNLSSNNFDVKIEDSGVKLSYSFNLDHFKRSSK